MLKDHPFAVEAFFERSVVLTFAVPAQQLRDMIPPCLVPDTFKDEWAFIAVAMVQTKDLRPAGFPKFMGNNFFLIGYRIFVRYLNNAGKRSRGLYIIKSETDKKKMELLGNVFTHYQYTTTDIAQNENDGMLDISSVHSGFHAIIDHSEKEHALPAGSPFADWKEARRFAGPLPFTFTFDAARSKVLIIEGAREHWVPQPVTVLENVFPALGHFNAHGAILASAFIINDTPYRWKKGKTELWMP